MTEKVILGLREALALDMTIKQACALNKIASRTYYEHLEKNPAFKEMMEEAKEMSNAKAKMVVGMAIEAGDVDTAKWALERREKENYSTKVDINQTGAGSVDELIKAFEARKASTTLPTTTSQTVPLLPNK